MGHVRKLGEQLFKSHTLGTELAAISLALASFLDITYQILAVFFLFFFFDLNLLLITLLKAFQELAPCIGANGKITVFA